MGGTNVENEINNSKIYIEKKVEELLPGDIILHPLYRPDGFLLIKRYAELNSLTIKQIKTHLNSNIPVLVTDSKKRLIQFITNKLFSETNFLKALEDNVHEINNYQKKQLEFSFYVDNRVDLDSYNKDENEQKHTFELDDKDLFAKSVISLPIWNSFGKVLESEYLKSRAKKIKEIILNKFLTDKSLFQLINELIAYDNFVITSGINTCFIALIIGLTLELSDDELTDLAVSALFCNIGLTRINKDEFQNYIRGKEYIKYVKEHVKESIRIIENTPYCRNKAVIYGIFEHHEYFNGKGFPSGKSGKEISLFGRIIGIAAGYDDLVEGYFSGEILHIDDALKTVIENKDLRFDPDILKIMISRTNFYKIGQKYIDNNNEEGVIIGFRNFIDAPYLPIVKYADGMVVDYYLKRRN